MCYKILATIAGQQYKIRNVGPPRADEDEELQAYLLMGFITQYPDFKDLPIGTFNDGDVTNIQFYQGKNLLFNYNYKFGRRI